MEQAAGGGFYPGFERLDMAASGVRFAGVMGGAGPPLLLLHGYPQTHIAWRKVAPALADRFTIVIPDLPGYGDSLAEQDGARWTKRRVAQALVQLMQQLGFQRFALAGHDRGGRVGYRLVLDHPGTVTRFAALAILPTIDALERVDYRQAYAAYHWFLLSQPADFPERLLAAAPDEVLHHAFVGMQAARDDVIEPAAYAHYLTAFRKSSVQHAMCEDYRSALDEDLLLDREDRTAGRQLDCPVLSLMPQRQADDSRAVWLRWAADVQCRTTSGAHLQAEDRPEEVSAALTSFFAAA